MSPQRISTYSSHRLEVSGRLVLKVGRVLDDTRLPDTLVGRVVNVRCGPLALVGVVLLHGGFPLATARCFLALGVADHRSEPIAVLLIIPVLRLLSLRVRNLAGLVVKPVSGLLGLGVNDLERRILVPVLRLGSFRIRNAGSVDPVLGLLVVGVVDLLLGIDRRVEVLKESTVLGIGAVHEDLEALVGLDDQGVDVRLLASLDHGG